MPDKPTLHVCHIDEGGPAPHACKRAQKALRASGLDYEKNVFAKGIPFGLFTKGKRPELKAMSGQEKLPVLQLPDGSHRQRQRRHHRLGQGQRPRRLLIGRASAVVCRVARGEASRGLGHAAALTRQLAVQEAAPGFTQQSRRWSVDWASAFGATSVFDPASAPTGWS